MPINKKQLQQRILQLTVQLEELSSAGAKQSD